MATVLAAVLSACTGAPAATRHLSPARSVEATTAPSGPNGLQAEAQRHAVAVRVLRARAAAVRRHDEAAWLAPLDPANTGLVRRERRLFANLTRLPLQTFTLTADKESTWPAGFAARRFQDTAYLPYVVQRMRLRGFDPEPLTYYYAYTFARVDGRWRIVSDTDVRHQAGLSSETQPWDVGSIRVHRTAHALGIFDAGSEHAAAQVMAGAEEAVRRVRRAVPRKWPGRVVFIALSDERLLRDMGETYLSAAAVAFPVPDDSMASDHIATTRVMINPSYLPEDAGEGVYLLSHEITHVALQDTNGGTPTWVQEGLAELVATDAGDPAWWRPTVTRAQARALRQLPRSTFFGNDDPALDYDASLAACVVLARRGGTAKLWRFVDGVSAAGFAGGDREAPVAPLLRRTYGLSERRLARQAGEFLASRLP